MFQRYVQSLHEAVWELLDPECTMNEERSDLAHVLLRMLRSGLIPIGDRESRATDQAGRLAGDRQLSEHHEVIWSRIFDVIRVMAYGRRSGNLAGMWHDFFAGVTEKRQLRSKVAVCPRVWVMPDKYPNRAF